MKVHGQDFALWLEMLHQERGRGSGLQGSSRSRRVFLFTSRTASSPAQSLLPSGSPARAKGHPASLRYTPHFIALHLTCCSRTPLGHLRSPFFALALDQRPVLAEPVSLPPRVPAGCQHLYTQSVFLNVSFVNGPNTFRPLAAVFAQLLGTRLPPAPQMMNGPWTPPRTHRISGLRSPAIRYDTEPQGARRGLVQLRGVDLYPGIA